MTKETNNNEEAVSQRFIVGKKGIIFSIIAACYTLLHLYILNFKPIEPWIFRALHLSAGLILGFIYFPSRQRTKQRITLFDWVLVLLSIIVISYIIVNHDQLIFRFGVVPTQMDFVIVLLGTVLLLEITRSTSGLALSILSMIFIFFIFFLYSFYNTFIIDILDHN